MVTYVDRPWVAQYPPGVEVSPSFAHTEMLRLWDASVERFGDRPFVHYFNDTLNFCEVDDLAEALAVALIAGGFERGERAGVYLQNGPQWPLTMLAVWKAGGITLALNPMFKGKELLHHLQDSGASVLVCLDSLYEDVALGVLDQSLVRRVITTHPTDFMSEASLQSTTLARNEPRRGAAGAEDLVALLERYAGQRVHPRQPPADVAVLTYTSGTTGPPKGAMNTHANLAYNSQLTSEWFSLGPDDVVLGAAPLFHITGLVAHMGVCMYSGAPLVLFHRFDPAECLRWIERWRATFTLASITVYIALMDHPEMDRRDLSSLSTAASGGAPISPAVVEAFRVRTGTSIRPVYGLTETTSPSHLPPPEVQVPVDPVSGALSVGVPVPGSLATVVDPETRREVPVGEAGEIVVSGPMVVPGYWEKPAETEHAIPGGRLHTGDIGFMDERGWFYVLDRAKDQINASGYKIWPREVEDVLYEHPSVREAAVVGKPDPYRGETVKAFVSLHGGAEAGPEELVAFCRERMAAYKYPREVEILPDLPKTASGKFLRRDLRDRELVKARKRGAADTGEAAAPQGGASDDA